MALIVDYDVICLCETRCDDADTNNVREVMVNSGFDIVCKNRSALSRYKSGGLLIAVRSELNIKWREMKYSEETLLSICINGRRGWIGE